VAASRRAAHDPLPAGRVQRREESGAVEKLEALGLEPPVEKVREAPQALAEQELREPPEARLSTKSSTLRFSRSRR
jgi:hypothetical protein